LSFRTNSRARFLLLALAAAAMLALAVPGLAAASTDGSIVGEVTAEDTGQPLAGVEVCAIGEEEECEFTDGAGEYELELPPDEYVVEFYTGGSPTTGRYVTEYYEDAASIEDADPVTVTDGGTATVDAELELGGVIEGTVFGPTGAPATGVVVCITGASSEEVGGCLETPSAGGYEFYGAASGSYKVEFSPETITEFEEVVAIPADGYLTQWWNGQPSFAAAEAISVTPPATVSGIDAHLVSPTPPPAPVVTAPVVPVKPVVPIVKPKPAPKCKRGTHKKTVKGKTRCVKAHHKKKKHQPRKHRAGHARSGTLAIPTGAAAVR
jgi:hypothetical protein